MISAYKYSMRENAIHFISAKGGMGSGKRSSKARRRITTADGRLRDRAAERRKQHKLIA